MTVPTAAPGGKRDVDASIHILGRAPIIGVGEPTTKANGAQVPTDTPAVATAVTQHLFAREIPCVQDVVIAHVGYAGNDRWPFAYYIGQRKGYTQAVAIAISTRLAARRPTPHTSYVVHARYAGYPYAAPLIDKCDVICEADIAIFITEIATFTSVGHLTIYANGAIVSTNTPSATAAK